MMLSLFFGRTSYVLVQPEMERGRSPLVSEYATLRAVIFKASIPVCSNLMAFRASKN
jgi:hypothetical protein